MLSRCTHPTREMLVDDARRLAAAHDVGQRIARRRPQPDAVVAERWGARKSCGQKKAGAGKASHGEGKRKGEGKIMTSVT